MTKLRPLALLLCLSPAWAWASPDYTMGAPSTHNGISYADRTHSASGLSITQFTSGLPQMASQTLNAQLSEYLDVWVQERANCLEGETTGTYQMSAPLVYASGDFVSFVPQWSLQCRGLPKIVGSSLFTVDAQTGQKVDLSRIVPKDHPPGRWAFHALKGLYPAQMNSQGRCDFGEPWSWETSDWRPTNAGAQIIPKIFANDPLCASPAWAVLPWEYLAKHGVSLVSIKHLQGEITP